MSLLGTCPLIPTDDSAPYLSNHTHTRPSGWEREIKPKAIEPLQRFLNEGMQDRKITDLFGPKQYVHIYTYVLPPWFGVYVQVYTCVGGGFGLCLDPYVVWDRVCPSHTDADRRVGGPSTTTHTHNIAVSTDTDT